MSFKVSSGKLKISSGKLSVTQPGITLRLEITHEGPEGGTSTHKYSIGAASNVSYDSNYLGRLAAQHNGDGSQSLHILEVFVPGAVKNDGTTDCWFYMENGDGMTPSFSGFEDEIEDGQPDTTNGRYPLTFAQGPPQCTISMEVQWEF